MFITLKFDYYFITFTFAGQDIETPSMSDDSSDHFDRDLSNVFIDQDKK